MGQDMEDVLAALFGGRGDPSDFGALLMNSIEKYEKEEESRVTEIDPDLRKVYNGMPAHTQQMIFHDDIRTAQRVILNIAELLPERKKLFGSDKKQRMEKAWELLANAWARSMIMPYDEIVKRMSADSRYSDIPKETLPACIAEALGFAYSRNPMLKDRVMFTLLTNRMISAASGKNSGIEDRYTGDPEYGLVPSKPVFVHGFGPQKAYLSSLVTSDGRKLTFERRGSTNVPGIDGPVDIYDLFLPDGEKYMRIYVCLYGGKNSRTTPAGLKFMG